MEWLSARHVDDIAALIAGCNFPDDALFLGERQPARVVMPKERQDLLQFVPFDPTLPFAKFASGRIFHRDFELRWQQDDGGAQVVYLGKREYCPSLLQEGGEIEMQQPRRYYLFGTRIQANDVQEIGPLARDGDFAEIRVPRLLRYPDVPKKAQRMLVTISECINAQTGQVEQYRFHGIKEASNNESL